MRRLLFLLIVFAASAIPASAQNAAFQRWCWAGGILVNTSGINSSNPVQGSYPQCQVEVFLTGTTTPATIFSNIGGTTPLANPFCANLDGSFLFWAALVTRYDITISNSTACNPAASGFAQLPAPFTWWDVGTGEGGGGGPGTCTQYGIADWATASTLGCIVSPVSGYFPIFQNAALPIAVAPSLIDSVASPVVTPLYTIQCDSATTIIDRAALLRFQSGASAVTIPLSTATGCGGLVTTAIDDGAGTLTFTATAPDTLSVYTGTTATDGTTSFTLTNGQYATLTQGFTGGWEARIVQGGGGGGGTGAQYQSAYFNPANTIVGFGPGIAGTIHTSQGLAAAPAMLPPVLVDSTASPVTTSPYTIQCDSSSTIIDRVHTLRFRSGASAVTVPLSTATGCPGLVVSLLGDGAGTVTFTRTSPDTFSVFTGSTNTDGATTFTLTNGQHVTLAQGATGIWEVVMGGGGTGSAVVNVPFDFCVPAQTTNAGNSFLFVNSFTHADLGVWQFTLDTPADVFCYLRVPHNLSGTTGTVIVDLASADTTSGHTDVFNTADSISTARNLNVPALTAAPTCTYTTTTTAYANTECAFTVQSTLAADQFYVVDIHQAASSSVTSNVQMPPPMLQITETF